MSKIILNGIEYSNGIIYQELQPVIYSDEEREIGVWRDGKPLYQKTILVTSIVSGNNTINHGISNVDKIVNTFGTFFSNANNSSPIPNGNLQTAWSVSMFDFGTTNFTISVGSSWVRYFDYIQVTIQYTKTTDTAGSGSWTPSGVKAVHYSTNEQVIGTWIDSKPLYQKTISFGALPNSTSKSVAHGISDLDKIVDFSALAKRPEPFNIIPLPSSHYQSTSAQQEISFNATNITIRNGNNASAYTDVYVTLQYTKTSD